MIIDAHVHLGHDRVFDEEQSEKEILDVMNANGVDAAVVQPMVDTPSIDAAQQIHNRIAEMSRQNPNRIFGMISINPHLKEKEFEEEATRCVQKLGFVGIKLTPIAHACNPLSKDGIRVFERANGLGIPVMVHTGSGIPFALPSLVMPVAKRFPQLKIVLAHAGGNISAGEALIVAQECENIFLEPSWVAIHIIQKWIKPIGAKRIMFGSDMLENCPVELAKFRSMGLSEEELQQCLYKTAKDFFNLPIDD
ncbi:MAG: amidohydrolase family protein [Clostridia bacterium]|jgi:predicted TIM-barrel fold metal-dependent hydrolase|nr:amidohydrolase family protein [Clostridia bacterium]